MSITLPNSIQLPNTGIGEALGAGIGQGVSAGLQGLLGSYFKERQQARQLDQLSKALGFTAQAATTPDINNQMPIEETSGSSPQVSNIERIATNPEVMTRLAAINPNMASQVQKMYENQLAREKFAFEKEKEQRKRGLVTPEAKERITDVFQRQEELLKRGNIGLGSYPKLLTEAGREDRAEFDTLGAAIESQLLPLLNKGVLSKPRFDYLLKNIPSSSDTQAKIRGKIKALKREFELLENKNGSIKSEAKQLDKDMAQKFLKVAGGNKDKARELAKKAGYTF